MRKRVVKKLKSEKIQDFEDKELETLPPITRALSGLLKGLGISEEDYRSYLEEKHA